MKSDSFLRALAIFLLCQPAAVTAPAQDLRLWYKQPAARWTEALPIGNGRMGGMIFGGVAQDRIQFNEETLWTGGPRAYSRPGAAAYLPQIRQLLAQGRQAEAEKLAGEEFLGLQSIEGNRSQWTKEMTSLKGLTGNPALPNYNDRNWKEIKVPAYDGWETSGLEGLDGAVWFRTGFDLPEGWKGKNLVLDLNRIYNHDLTYINGRLAGSTDGAEPRKYIISKELLTTGRNTIAIQVLNYFDKGGIGGYKDSSRHIGLYPEGDSTAGKISLSKNWKYLVQNDAPPPVPHYQADYQPFGDLLLNFADSVATGYRRELDVQTAVSTLRYRANGVRYAREYLVSQPGQVMIIRLTADKAGSISFTAALKSPHRNFHTEKIDGSTLRLSVKVKDGALRGESWLRIVAEGGELVVGADKITVSNAGAATLYLAAATNYKNYRDVSADPAALCKQALQNVAGKTYPQLKEAHVKEYQSYFNTFSINLGKGQNEDLATDERLQKFAASSDPSFVALYVQYGRYLLISSSRPGTGPANLQGIWNDLLTPPWGSKYTTNINLEMNYWPAELLNLSPLNEPLFNMLDELAQTGRQTARDHYNAPGWVLHHNTDLWRGTAPINASNHGIWVTGGAWLCHHLWEHYLFTRDKHFLQTRAYPLMKEAALFFHSFLTPDPKTGWLISTPSNSPENGGLVAGPTMDHQIIRDLFKNVMEAGRILQIDKSFSDSLQEQYNRIAPNQVGRYGQLQEWLQDKDDTASKHRHVSHLWGVYPGTDITWDGSPEIMKAARQSLLYRGDQATGWSLAWKVNFWARFKDGNHAYRLLQLLLRPAGEDAGSYPNLFDAHPPFQIDGNFGAAAGMGEMLLQSHAGYLDLLPALPEVLPGGRVNGLCAHGGFVLNLQWQQGQLQGVEVYSKAGETCVLQYKDRRISFPTQKGGRYRFTGNLQKAALPAKP